MAVKVAINGFGRIGRLAFRYMFESPEFEIVAINDLTDSKTLAHLLKYDSAQGSYKANVEAFDGAISVNGKTVKIYSEKDPVNLPWGQLGVDVVIECTGFFTKLEDAEKHIQAGARKVVISAPGSGKMKTIVYNVNHETLTGEETVISAASCTTNCLAPVAKVLHEQFGLVKGYMTTVHAYTNDQRILDAPHKDLRRARSGAVNIIPTTTGAAAAVGKVLPELLGRLDGMALRVPTITGSVVDLVCELKDKDVTEEAINAAIKNASNETLGYTEDPIVSTDVIGCSFGSWFDALSTSVMEVDGKKLVKILTWYDNEASYTHQLVRTAKYFASLF